MKNLGKIGIILFLFLSTFAQAQVRASLDALKVEEGELVTLSIETQGSDVKKPNIQKICGEDVVSTSQSTNMQMINRTTSKSTSFSYQFFAKKSCEIPAYEIEVDGKIYKTTPLHLKVGAPSQNVDQDFLLDLQSSKTEVYRLEPFELLLTFKQKKGVGVVDSEFSGPKLQGFWMHGEPKQEQFTQGEYSVTKLHYTISAQRDTNLSITPAEIKIATRTHTRDSWGMWSPKIKWKTYRSNGLDIGVKALPAGVELVGEFRIDLEVDKTNIEANEAVNVNLKVQGRGNLEDIASMKPFIKDVSVFDEKALIEGGVWQQKFAFVADRDFVIPPFTLRYFDLKTQKIQEISTQALTIKVQNALAKEEMVIYKPKENAQGQKPQNAKESEYSLGTVLIAFFGGVLLTIGVFFLKNIRFLHKQKRLSIENEKLLLVKLLPFKEDKEVQEILDILEKNIYQGEKNKIEKKKLKALVKKYL